MKIRHVVSVAAFLAIALSPATALAQSAIAVPTQQATAGAVPVAGELSISPFVGLIGPRFIMATLVGVALALAFQLILTNLSFAAGLNLAGATSSSTDSVTATQDWQPFDSAKKTIDVIGIWAALTTTIALFFAGLLAGVIGYVVHPESGAVLGLGIWAVFLLIMVRLESRVLSSLAGSLFSVAGATLTTALNTTRGLATSITGVVPATSGAEGTHRIRNGIENSDAAYRQKEQVRNMVRRLSEQTELTPEAARDLFYEFLHDPKAGTDHLIARLKRIDREHVKEVLTEHEDISEVDAEEIIARYESTRDEIVNSIDRTRTEAEQYALRAKEAAGRNAEKTRQLVAHVAWWSFCTALLSGAAAAIGGTVAALANV